MARANKRVGYNNNSGAINPRTTFGTEKPIDPKQGDVHIDFVRGAMGVYNGTSWDDYYLIYVSATEPTNKNVLWLDIS